MKSRVFSIALNSNTKRPVVEVALSHLAVKPDVVGVTVTAPVFDNATATFAPLNFRFKFAIPLANVWV